MTSKEDHASHFAIEWHPAAVKELEKCDKHVARKIIQRVDELRTNPRPVTSRALVGYSNLFRIRVSDYRIVYTLTNERVMIVVLMVGHRRSIYRNLSRSPRQ